MLHHKLLGAAAGAAFALGLALAPAPAAWACSAAGPQAHVGRVTAVDPRGGTFTLQDAETGRPITFRAEARLLRQVRVGQQVLVRYRPLEGGGLQARSISL